MISLSSRRPLAVVAVVAAALLLGGCSFAARNLTQEPYAPSDGLQADLGDVLVRNVLVVSQGSGEPGLVSATLVNRGEQDATVAVQVAEIAAEIAVPAGASVLLGSADGEGEVVEIDSVESVAGGTIAVSFNNPASDSVSFEVPILRPEGPYADLVPAGTD